VGPKFQGVKMIPPGVHFLSWQAPGKGNQFAPTVSCFVHLEPQCAHVRRWNPTEELALPPADEEEVGGARMGRNLLASGAQRCCRRQRRRAAGTPAPATAPPVAAGGARGCSCATVRAGRRPGALPAGPVPRVAGTVQPHHARRAAAAHAGAWQAASPAGLAGGPWQRTATASRLQVTCCTPHGTASNAVPPRARWAGR